MKKLAALVVLVLVAAGCGGGDTSTPSATSPAPAPAPATAPSAEPEAADELPAGLVRQDTFEGTWPFGSDEALLSCGRGEVLTAEIDGELYALNGPAISAGFTELVLETPNDIWLDNPSTGVKVSLRDITIAARAQC